MAPSEKELLYAAIKGDPHAFSTIFEEYRPKLYARALQILGHGDDAKDAVQDSFIKGLSNIQQLQDHEKLEAWLFTILKNECYLVKRAERTSASIIKKAEAKNIQKVSSIDNIEKQFEQAHLNKRVRQFISVLAPKKRLTVLIRYFSSFNSYRQISKILDIPMGTVRSRLSKARKELQEMATNKSPYVPIHNEKQQQFREAWENLYAGKRQQFLNVFDDELEIRFTSGQWQKGIKRWATEWDVDLETGVRFKPNVVVSAKDMTIVEGPIINPPDKPGHCPPAGSFVFYHDQEQVTRAHVHYSDR